MGRGRPLSPGRSRRGPSGEDRDQIGARRQAHGCGIPVEPASPRQGPPRSERCADQERLGRPLRDRLPARRAGIARDLAVHVVPAEWSRWHGLSLVGAVRGRTIRCFRHCILLGDTGSGQAGHAGSRRAAPCPPDPSVTPQSGGSRRGPSPPDRAATVRASAGASDPGPGRCRRLPACPSVAATGSARRSPPRTICAPCT